MSMPQVPPRPARTQEQTGSSNSLGSDLPKIPPRPTNRGIDRSISPSRESFARSPLNEMPHTNHGSQNKHSLYATGSANTSSTELPPRPSSVVLPSIGQEGMEYAEVFESQLEMGTSPTTSRNIANDLKLHAPKPSLPISSAKRRVSAVTRTDSGQAAAFGIGKAVSDDADPPIRSLKKTGSVASQNSQFSNGTERPPSSHESDHGIPEIGQRVPMYPHAGDVQAPSPAGVQQPFAPGIGFHNDGSKPRHHGRRTSGRGVEIPFDAYGKHGHGQIPKDRFETAYYEKHPELYKKETGHYHGPFADGRSEFAMSTEDLNKIVRDTASRGAGIGSSPTVIGTPSEQIGFQATEEYTSRMSSPRPVSGYHVAHSNASFSSQTYADSPLKESHALAITDEKEEFEGGLAKGLQTQSEAAVESEVEDEDTIHVDAPGRRSSKIYAAFGHLDSAEDLHRHSSHDGQDSLHDEHGYGAPILASDEVAKEPFGWELQPAVSPLQDRHHHEEGGYHLRSGSASSLNGSRPTSRPGSIHGPPLFHVSSSTPLEDLEEYEPLFPEDEKAGQAAIVKRPETAADRLKRPELMNRKFPSQDIWEDTPNSLQYTATVSTPQLPEDEVEETRRASQVRENETPAEAFARRQEELAENQLRDSESFLHREKKPWAHNAHLVAETRPNLKQRFPSRDIWEDTPDSHKLETTVGGPQSEDKEALSTPSERPTTGAVVYHHEKAAAGFPLSSEEGRATTGIAATLKPSVPARPIRAKPSDQSPTDRTQPAIPGRPKSKLSEGSSPPIPLKTKPVIPARPAKPITRDSSENVPLTKTVSNSSAKSIGSDSGSAIAGKPKPPVPSRPVGSKIAALQGGFMSELNKKLQLGPKKEEVVEEPEPEKEKAPLVDARKGRARGPARRAPAKSPAPAAVLSSTFSFSNPSTVWQIDPERDLLHVISGEEKVAPIAGSSSPKPDISVPASSDIKESQEISEVLDAKVAAAPISETLADDLPIQPKDAEKTSLPVGVMSDETESEPVKASEVPLPAAKPVEEADIAPNSSEEELLSTATADSKESSV